MHTCNRTAAALACAVALAATLMPAIAAGPSVMPSSKSHATRSRAATSRAAIEHASAPRAVADEAAIERASDETCLAFERGDVAKLAELLSDDFTLTDSRGTVTTRADAIEEARTKAVRYEVFKNHDMKIRLHGDAAIVTGRTTVKGRAGDTAFAAEFQFTDTLVRVDGRWRYAASHVSRVP